MRAYCPCCKAVRPLRYDYGLEILECVECGEDADHLVFNTTSIDLCADRQSEDMLRFDTNGNRRRLVTL